MNYCNVLISPAAKSIELNKFFQDQREALGGVISLIASSVGKSETPKVLSESFSIIQKKTFSGLGLQRFSGHGRRK